MSGIIIHALTRLVYWPHRRLVKGSREEERGMQVSLPCQLGLLSKEKWAFITPELRHPPLFIHSNPQLVPWEGGPEKRRPSEGGCL